MSGNMTDINSSIYAHKICARDRYTYIKICSEQYKVEKNTELVVEKTSIAGMRKISNWTE